MPDRWLRAGIVTSERVNALSWPAEVFYRRLLSVIDDFGLFDARPEILRAELYAFKLENVRTADIGTWMRECAEAGLVREYAVKGKPYLFYRNHGQRCRAKKPKWPLPLDDDLRSEIMADANICGHLSADDNSRGHPQTNAPVNRQSSIENTPLPPKGGGILKKDRGNPGKSSKPKRPDPEKIRSWWVNLAQTRGIDPDDDGLLLRVFACSLRAYDVVCRDGGNATELFDWLVREGLNGDWSKPEAYFDQAKLMVKSLHQKQPAAQSSENPATLLAETLGAKSDV